MIFWKTPKTKEPIEAYVLEAYSIQGDNQVRLSSLLMKEGGFHEGDVLEITKNGNSILGICKKFWQSDENGRFVRIRMGKWDELGVSRGDIVKITQIECEIAEKVIITPLEDDFPPIDERYITDTLKNYPIRKNDILWVDHFGKTHPTKVIVTVPDADVITNESTQFLIAVKTE